MKAVSLSQVHRHFRCITRRPIPSFFFLSLFLIQGLIAVAAKPPAEGDEDAPVILHLLNVAETEYLYDHARYADLHDLVASGQLASTAKQSPDCHTSLAIRSIDQ
jgi:hypothetical protein